jgi:hypothetical protein
MFTYKKVIVHTETPGSYQVTACYATKENIDFPDLYNDTTYNQAFLVGIGKPHKPIQIIKDFYESIKNKGILPPIQKLKYSGQVLTYASNEYHTCVSNSLWMNFDKRQIKHLKFLLTNSNTSKKRIGKLRKYING